MNRYGFWYKYSHHDLGYKPDQIMEFSDCGVAWKYAERCGFECFDAWPN